MRRPGSRSFLIYSFAIIAMSLQASKAVAQTEPHLRAVTFDENGLTLELRGVGPAMYRLEHSEDLRQWQPLSTNLVNESGVSTLSTPIKEPHRFYRAALLEELAYIPGEILYRFKPAIEPVTENEITGAFKLTEVRKIQTAAM